MFDNTILSINELAKLRVSLGSSVGGVGSQYKVAATSSPIATATTQLTTLDTTNFTVYTGSISYMAGFNHGGGQFSVTALSYYSGNNTGSQFYVRPYTINQSTGAITLGTGNTVWNNGSGSSVSTSTWGQAGPYIFNTGNHTGPSRSSNFPITAVGVVSNNNVSGTSTNHGRYQPNNNGASFCTWDGNIAYWIPTVYDEQNNNQPTRYAWTSSGSSNLSNVNTSTVSSDTSTNRILPVIRQAGTNGPTGTLFFYRGTGNDVYYLSILDNNANVVNNFNTGALGIPFTGFANGFGIELSNGRQLFYFSDGSIVLRNGSSLSVVTETADFIPLNITDLPISHITPIAANTWIGLGSVGGVRQVVKFSINPTTYKVTIAGAYPIANLLPNLREIEAAFRLGCFVTGSNNQFLVLVTNGNQEAPKAIIRVYNNPLTGVS